MRAAQFDTFAGPIGVRSVPDPEPPRDGAVVRVHANGICRSDWHAWQGHDPNVRLPHVPGHELAGEVVATGPDCPAFRAGDRVTVPFVMACGSCPSCWSGQQQICEHQRQPGFTQWGAFAEYVAVPNAASNLVRLPENLGYPAAASLGCRFTTAYRALIEQGRLQTGEWVAVHACGGVGLSAVMIAVAAGAHVVAVDVNAAALDRARALGASASVNAATAADVAEAVRDASNGGAHVSLDALGHTATCRNSIRGLRQQGRHVQVGLLTGEHAAPPLPMDEVIARELELRGSHGMAGHRFPTLFRLIETGRLDPAALISRHVSLAEGAERLMAMDRTPDAGIAVITSFG
ncbi:alcohol dehydrogenase [Limimonas halophila]|uniref:Alcohol dehydrogenase n=1 Tax=Limimonas halophila TaxID=1082479 RepID=A0A1G7SQP4_9PROT|nr:zinc-dependent alcohol dehydrogenase family protein [Limimonas halophila]SDG25375.1 alcohol dehydrogenase [Limimonas halophila]